MARAVTNCEGRPSETLVSFAPFFSPFTPPPHLFPHLPLASSSSYLPSVQKDKRAFLASSSLPSSSVISRERERERGIELDGMGWRGEGGGREEGRCQMR